MKWWGASAVLQNRRYTSSILSRRFIFLGGDSSFLTLHIYCIVRLRWLIIQNNVLDQWLAVGHVERGKRINKITHVVYAMLNWQHTSDGGGFPRSRHTASRTGLLPERSVVDLFQSVTEWTVSGASRSGLHASRASRRGLLPECHGVVCFRSATEWTDSGASRSGLIPEFHEVDCFRSVTVWTTIPERHGVDCFRSVTEWTASRASRSGLIPERHEVDCYRSVTKWTASRGFWQINEWNVLIKLRLSGYTMVIPKMISSYQYYQNRTYHRLRTKLLPPGRIQN